MSRFDTTDDLYRAYLKNKRGLICEICGKSQEQLAFPLSVFHILSKGSQPKLRYDELNTLIVCWSPGQSNCCHNIWHSSGHSEWMDRRREVIKQRICALRGYKTWDALRTDLKIRAHIARRVDLKMLNIFYRQKLKSDVVYQISG